MQNMFAPVALTSPTTSCSPCACPFTAKSMSATCAFAAERIVDVTCCRPHWSFSSLPIEIKGEVTAAIMKRSRKTTGPNLTSAILTLSTWIGLPCAYMNLEPSNHSSAGVSNRSDVLNGANVIGLMHVQLIKLFTVVIKTCPNTVMIKV